MTASRRIDLADADVRLFADAYPDHEALCRDLIADAPWRADKIRMFGREVAMPRLTCWMGDAEYTYSGLVNPPAPWHPLVQAIRARAEALSGTPFNGVLMNFYRDGADSMGWHADDERELGDNPVIASVSLGAERRMRFKAKKGRMGETVALDLPGGSLLLMQGGTQANWLHEIPRTKRPVAPRVNLTFRRIF